VETKPWVFPGERRQGGPAVDRHEEARLHGPTGWRFGLSQGRAPCASAKSALPAPLREAPAVAQAVTDRPLTGVLHAIMPSGKHVHTTGEVPQRLWPPVRVTASYKRAAKGEPHALAAGTGSYWPSPWGCQQRQSSPPTRDQRRYRSRSVTPSVVFGKVSSTAAATTWPAGTSSWQPVGRLRNVPRHDARSTRTKRPGERLP
jgi:hypothetical protein